MMMMAGNSLSRTNIIKSILLAILSLQYEKHSNEFNTMLMFAIFENINYQKLLGN